MKYINEIPSIWQRTDFEGYHNGYITTSIKKTDKGFKIKRFSHYVSIQSIDLKFQENGTAKATIKVDKNYHAPFQYTMYFDKDLKEVENRKEWLKLQNSL